MRKKIIFIVSIICLTSIVFSIMCKSQNDIEQDIVENIEIQEIKDKVDESVNVLGAGNMDSINEVVFPGSQYEAEKVMFLKQIDTDNDAHEEGIMPIFFEKANIEVESIDEKIIVFEVTAPDMSSVYEVINFKKCVSEEALKEFLCEYMENAEKKITKVSLEYSMINEQMEIDFTSYEFIDAVTGGMVTVYVEAYQEMLNEYASGVKE